VGSLFPHPAGAIDPATLKKIPMETRWAFASGAFTYTDTLLSKALFDQVGREAMEEIHRKWQTAAGQGAKQTANALGLSAQNAKEAAEVISTLTFIYCGPEEKFETVEATPERAVVRCLVCPRANRRKEMGITDDLCSAMSQTWWDSCAKSFNPQLTATLTKAMPWGNPYCEWVIELQA